jgi:hypothetical protein
VVLAAVLFPVFFTPIATGVGHIPYRSITDSAVKYGGPGKKKQACKRRACTNFGFFNAYLPLYISEHNMP